MQLLQMLFPCMLAYCWTASRLRGLLGRSVADCKIFARPCLAASSRSGSISSEGLIFFATGRAWHGSLQTKERVSGTAVVATCPTAQEQQVAVPVQDLEAAYMQVLHETMPVPTTLDTQSLKCKLSPLA